MDRLRLEYFIVAGLLAWGLPAVAIAGTNAAVVVLAGILPFGILAAMPTRVAVRPFEPSSWRVITVLVIVLGYLILDAAAGRQKLSQNLFLSKQALDVVVESANEGISRGRNIPELLGAVAIFLPFALFDAAHSASRGMKVLLRLVALVFVFYETGISRGFLLMAVLSAMLGLRLTFFRTILSIAGGLLVFLLASFVRGDFADVMYGNPLADALVVPYVNLALLLDSACGAATSSDFLVEFAKKFLPGFLADKTIFSFNIEMTQCIYPFFGTAVPSISIFTYLGEYFYYQPPWITALIAGGLLAGLGNLAEARLRTHEMASTRMFAGLMCLVLLRSRVLDVLSFLVFLVLFLIGWRLLLSARWAGVAAGQAQPIDARPDQESV